MVPIILQYTLDVWLLYFAVQHNVATWSSKTCSVCLVKYGNAFSTKRCVSGKDVVWVCCVQVSTPSQLMVAMRNREVTEIVLEV